MIEEPPVELRIELPEPPTSGESKTHPTTTSSLLPLPATKVIDEPLDADRVSLPVPPNSRTFWSPMADAQGIVA